MTEDKAKTCERCGKFFPKKHDLERHRARKTPCGFISSEDLPEDKRDYDHACICGRRFETTQYLRAHEARCQFVPRSDNSDEVKQTIGELLKRSRELDELKKRVDGLEESKEGSVTNDRSHNQDQKSAVSGDQSQSHLNAASGASSINAPIDNSIKINIFGNEFTKYVTQEEVLNLMNEIGGPAGGDGRHALPSSESLRSLVVRAGMLLYSNEKYPENITCFMDSRKKGTAMVHEADGWKQQPCKQVMKKMAAGTIDMLFQQQPYAGEHGIDESEDMDNCTNLLTGLREEEKKIKEDPPMDFYAILERNRAIVQKTFGRLPKVGEKMEQPDPTKRVLPKFIDRFTVFDAERVIRRKRPSNGIDLKYATEVLVDNSLRISKGEESLMDRARARIIKKFGEANRETKAFSDIMVYALGLTHNMLKKVDLNPPAEKSECSTDFNHENCGVCGAQKEFDIFDVYY